MRYILLIAASCGLFGCNANKEKANKCSYEGHQEVIFRTPEQMASEDPNQGWVYVNGACQIDSFYDGSVVMGAPGITQEDFSKGQAAIKFSDGRQPVVVEEFTPYDPKEDQ